MRRLFAAGILAGILAVPGDVWAQDFDAATSSNNVTDGTDPSAAHTPVGAPAGALLLLVVHFNVALADNINGCTYGGSAMAEVDGSPFQVDSNVDRAIHAYFLGSSVPAGEQTATCDQTSDVGNSTQFVVATITGSTTLQVDSDIQTTATGTNPTATLATTTGVETFVMAAMFTEQSDIGTATAVGGDFTELQETDIGAIGASYMRRTTNPTGGNVTVNWTDAGSESYSIFAVGIRETPASTERQPGAQLFRGFSR